MRSMSHDITASQSHTGHLWHQQHNQPVIEPFNQQREPAGDGTTDVSTSWKSQLLARPVTCIGVNNELSSTPASWKKWTPSSNDVTGNRTMVSQSGNSDEKHDTNLVVQPASEILKEKEAVVKPDVEPSPVVTTSDASQEVTVPDEFVTVNSLSKDNGSPPSLTMGQCQTETNTGEKNFNSDLSKFLWHQA